MGQERCGVGRVLGGGGVGGAGQERHGVQVGAGGWRGRGRKSTGSRWALGGCRQERHGVQARSATCGVFPWTQRTWCPRPRLRAPSSGPCPPRRTPSAPPCWLPSAASGVCAPWSCRRRACASCPVASARRRASASRRRWSRVRCGPAGAPWAGGCALSEGSVSSTRRRGRRWRRRERCRGSRQRDTGDSGVR